MTTDDAALAAHTPTDWPPELVESLDRWELAHLVPSPPLFWAQYYGDDLVTNLSVSLDEGEPGPLTTVQLEAHVPYGIIVSQTCDVAARGPGVRHPTVQVCPVVQVDEINANRLAAIARFDVGDRALLQPPDLEGRFIADLRISVPLSKGALAKFEPMRAFAEENDVLAFADHLARKIDRPALHDFLSGDVRAEIRTQIRAERGDPSWYTKVEEVRVLTTPTRLQPVHAQLLVVAQSSLSPEERTRWHNLSESLVRRGRSHTIELRSPWHETSDELRASVYRRSVALDIPELRTAPKL